MMLLVLLMIYIPLFIWVWKSPVAAKFGLQRYGPTIKINTKLGLRLMDRLGKYHHFWRGFGVASQIFAFVEMVFMVFMIVFSVTRIPSMLQSSSKMGIEYVLAIPGLNPIMPFWFALAALIVALVFHEFCHGVQTKSNGMDVVNTGALYCVVPVGAFVEPDEKQIEKASRTAKLDLYSAGISANFIIAGVAFLVFSSVLLGCVSNQYLDNAAVYSETSGSRADEAGIPVGAIILQVGGKDYRDSDDYTATWFPGDSVPITYITEDNQDASQPEIADLTWGVYVTKIADDSPASEYSEELSNSIIAYAIHEIHEDDSKKKVYFYTQTQFSNFMDSTKSGETITIGYVPKGGSEVMTKEVKLASKSGSSSGYLGIFYNISGMSICTPGSILSLARNPFHSVSNVTDIPTSFISYLVLPFNGFDPIPSSIQWWYGDNSSSFWRAVELFYWIFWLNILLGITNALPAIPFDGGFIFQGWVDRLLERLGRKDKEKREKQVDEITKNISMLFIFAFVMVIAVAIV